LNIQISSGIARMLNSYYFLFIIIIINIIQYLGQQK
jgi:hypothetical protein